MGAFIAARGLCQLRWWSQRGSSSALCFEFCKSDTGMVVNADMDELPVDSVISVSAGPVAGDAPSLKECDIASTSSGTLPGLVRGSTNGLTIRLGLPSDSAGATFKSF